MKDSNKTAKMLLSGSACAEQSRFACHRSRFALTVALDGKCRGGVAPIKGNNNNWLHIPAQVLGVCGPSPVSPG